VILLVCYQHTVLHRLINSTRHKKRPRKRRLNNIHKVCVGLDLSLLAEKRLANKKILELCGAGLGCQQSAHGGCIIIMPTLKKNKIFDIGLQLEHMIVTKPLEQRRPLPRQIRSRSRVLNWSPDPDDFLVQRRISDNIFIKVRSAFPETRAKLWKNVPSGNAE